MSTNNEKKIKDYLARIFDCINNKLTLSIDYEHIESLGNLILSIDNKCADFYFLRYIFSIYKEDRARFWYNVLNSDDGKEILHNIFFSTEYNYYLYPQDKYKDTIKSFFLQSIMADIDYDINYFFSINLLYTRTDCSRVNINTIANCFYYVDRTLTEFEENSSALRKYLSSTELEEIIDYFQHSISNAILPVHQGVTVGYWTKKEQNQFKYAFFNRFLLFTKKIGYEKEVNLSFNYGNVQKKSVWFNIFSSLIFPPIFVFLLLEIVYCYCIIGRKGKILLKKYSDVKLTLALLQEKDVKSSCIFIKRLGGISILDKISPVLANDLKNLELVKDKLSTYYSSQELFDNFMRVNYEMYIIPCINYLKGKEEISSDELERFHRIFTKVKDIFVKKIDDFEHQRNLISNIEFDVIEQDIDNKLKFN